MTLTLRSSFVAVALSASVLLGTAACGSGDGGGTASAQGGDAPAAEVADIATLLLASVEKAPAS